MHGLNSYFCGLCLPWTLMQNENDIIIGLKMRSQQSNGESGFTKLQVSDKLFACVMHFFAWITHYLNMLPCRKHIGVS